MSLAESLASRPPGESKAWGFLAERLAQGHGERLGSALVANDRHTTQGHLNSCFCSGFALERVAPGLGRAMLCLALMRAREALAGMPPEPTHAQALSAQAQILKLTPMISFTTLSERNLVMDVMTRHAEPGDGSQDLLRALGSEPSAGDPPGDAREHFLTARDRLMTLLNTTQALSGAQKHLHEACASWLARFEAEALARSLPEHDPALTPAARPRLGL